MKLCISFQQMMSSNHQAHVVCLPVPFQSHIKAMLKLAKLLYAKHFRITFINTEFNHQRLLKARGPGALSGLPGFRFETMPDGLPPAPLDAGQDVPTLCRATMEEFSDPFRVVMERIRLESEYPVTCIVSDGFMTFPIGVGEELGIPVVMFFTVSACSLLPFFYYRGLQERDISPLKDESYLTNGFLDNTVIDWIPGLNKTMRLKDLPTFLYTTDPDDTLLKFGVQGAANAPRASAVVILTLDALEAPALSALSPDILPNVFTIAPIQLLLDEAIDDPREREALASVDSNLWAEEPRCIQWLDAHATPGSVLYVNFGSVAMMSRQDLVEFGFGLANSKVPFLWIIRPDLVEGDTAVLPPEFHKETKDRSFITSWCAQEEALRHPAVGGFLTHCGWNSTMESLTAGVPMICWKFFGDQTTHSWYICNEWGVGMEVDRDVKRGQVEEAVREVMEGPRGKAMKRKAAEWKRKAREAVGPVGSSSLALNGLITFLLSKT